MVKICAIGDPHGNIGELKKFKEKVDFCLLTGDLGKADLARKKHFENIKRQKKRLSEIGETPKEQLDIHLEIHNSTLKILKYLSKISPVYTIAGNVGVLSNSDAKKESEKLSLNFPSTRKEIDKLRNVHIVKNSLRNLGGIRVGFLEYFIDVSWVKEFKPLNYSKSLKNAIQQTKKAKKVLKGFGNNLDILICHQPPYGLLDKVDFKGVPKDWKGKHAGSKSVLEYIKKYKPRYVFCGHIHEGEGNIRVGKTEVYNLGVAKHLILDI